MSRLEDPVLVTGATGFIGRHLVRRLIDEGRRVTALVLPGEAPRLEWAGRVEVRQGDVADPAAVGRAAEGAGTVVHLAAVVTDWGAKAWHERVTVGGTRHVLGAAARAGARAVLASSIVVYGGRLGRETCTEDTPFGHPRGIYSRCKQAQERVARELETEAGLRLTIVRPANVFGPGSGPWVEELVGLLRRGRITLISGGDFNAGLCHVDNLVELLLRAASREEALGRVYNAADGSDVTWRRYVSDLARLASTRPPRSAPHWLVTALAPPCEVLWSTGWFARRPPITREAVNLAGSHHRIPIERARRELGYRPVKSYAEAIEELGQQLESMQIAS